MRGRRVDISPHRYQLGDYGAWNGCFHAMTPFGLLANLGGHDVQEHADGSITARPAIRVRGWDGQVWHGYLESGRWRGR